MSKAGEVTGEYNFDCADFNMEVFDRESEVPTVSGEGTSECFLG